MKIIYKKILFLIFILPFSMLSQNTLKGTVLEKKSAKPIPEVDVKIVGSTDFVSTDDEGKFELPNVKKGDRILFSYLGLRNVVVEKEGETIVSFIGYKDYVFTYDSQKNVTVYLEQDEIQIEEVVFTGYSKERKVDVTGAVVVVELKPILGQSMSSGNAMQALQGRVAGLFVEKSGDPIGTNSTILIRGVSTLGNTAPLYVIDGVPTVRPEVFASLNPSTIESVQVLKDASASSIYGSRAANGVIVVTTKNTFKGERMNVSYSTSISTMSEKKQRYKMLNAVERGKVLWQASVNDGALPEEGYGEIYNFDWNHNLSNPVLNNVIVQSYVGGDTNVPAGDTDWQDVMYKAGFVSNNDLSVSGGTEKANAMLNLGYLNNTGMLKYTNYERYTARLNANFKLFNDKVRFGINSQFTQSNERLVSTDIGNEPTTRTAISLAPTIPVYTSFGEFAGPLGSGYSDRNNPLLMQFLNRWDNTKRVSLFGNIFTEIDLLKDLTFRNSVGIDFNDYSKKDIEPRVTNGSVNRTYNSLTYDTNKYSSLTISNTLNYNVKLSNHKIGVVVGIESIKTDLNSLLARAEGFEVETESYFVLSAASGARTSNGISTGSKLLSQFGKINYAFSDKYLATFTIRRDGSSRFGQDNRYGVFPAATVGWKINNEDFLKDVKAISLLKLRAGYGGVGNQSIGDNARFGLYEARYGTNQYVYVPDFFNIYYNVGTAYDLNGANTGNLPSGFVAIQAANSGLKWESTKEVNLGLDFEFLGNKLSGSFDYFSRKTDGILIRPPVAAVLGEGQQRFVNGASTANKGWEFVLGYSDTLENGLNFNVTTNFGATKNKITQLPEEVRSAYSGTAANSIIGHSQFEFFGYKTDGLFQSQEDIDSHATQVASRLGGIKYVDINGDGVINSDDRTFIGSTQPKLEYGINVSLAYKNIDMSIFGSGVTGRKGVDQYIYWNNFVQGRENAGPGTLNAWTPTNTNTDVPSLSLAHNDTQMSTYFLRNNSYFKVRSIQLGYTLPEEITNKTGFLTNCRVYLQGENLFWFTPKGYIGSDPERTDVNRIPIPTTFSLGVNFAF
jgi:TonB-linked SusC/RagA family outer membrane protein